MNVCLIILLQNNGLVRVRDFIHAVGPPRLLVSDAAVSLVTRIN